MPRLDFSANDHDEYWNHKDALLDELRGRLGATSDEEVIGDAGMFLDWTVNYGDGDLSAYDVDDIEEYLLEWCPRKVSSGPEGYLSLIAGVKEWITHLILTDQWTGGKVQPLLRSLESIVPEFLDAMSDPAKFGLAKGMLMGPALAGADIDLDDPDSLQAAMDAFNSLSLEERKALTDPFIGRVGQGAVRDERHEPSIDLPPTPAPDPAVVAAKAALAPLVVQLDAVREHLGSKGIKLTAAGNPKLVDAKVLRDLFDTDDQWEQMSADGTMKPVRSADSLPHLQYLLLVSVVAGAINDDGKCLRATSGWDDLDPLQRCQTLFDSVRKLGPGRAVVNRYRIPFFEAMSELMDVGVLHLVTGAFVNGEVAYEELLDRAVDIVTGELSAAFPERTDRGLTEFVDSDLSRCIDSLERCGVVDRRDVETVPHKIFGIPTPSGGRVVMGDLGRQLMDPVLPTLGYRANELADLSACSASEAAQILDNTPFADPAQIWTDWLPDTDAADKVDQLIDALDETGDPYGRVSLMALINESPADARRRIEAIIDGPYGSYALMALDGAFDGSEDSALDEDSMETTFLADGRSLADAFGELGPAVTLLPAVDMLWIEMDSDPDTLFESIARFGPSGSSDFVAVLDDLWRVQIPQTAELLEFLGNEHPEKSVAKACRKALFRLRGAGPSSR